MTHPYTDVYWMVEEAARDALEEWVQHHRAHTISLTFSTYDPEVWRLAICSCGERTRLLIYLDYRDMTIRARQEVTPAPSDTPKAG